LGFLIQIIFVLILWTKVGAAAVIDGTLATSAITYKDSNQSTTGISARARYRQYGAGADSSGQFLMADMPGISPVYGQFAYGYGWSTKGNTSFELGAGVTYSLLWSLGAVVNIGTSFELGSGFFVSLPVFLYTTIGVQFTPFIGWRF
jgi:hypothetical protein